MLIDHALIEVASGRGGDGAVSFLHDKNTEYGGPDGGNGGRGGHVYFRATHNLNNLYRFRHGKLFRAEDGKKGGKKNMNGLQGADLYVDVPLGTLLIRESDHFLLGDLKEEGEILLVAKGGRGGRGNASFKSSRRRIPRFAEGGEPGERFRILLELKSIADIGLIGFPNAGKSTFLNVVSRANVETGDYPFTTISPNLGTFYSDEGKRYIVADLPGLIEGASEGKGLGLTFLRHAERCRVLLHLVSMSEDNPYERYKIIREELMKYGAHLEDRPEVVIASKMDDEFAEARKKEFDAKLGFASFPLSSYTRQGIDEILSKARYLADVTPSFPLKEEETSAYQIYEFKEEETPLLVKKDKAHEYHVEGKAVTELLKRASFVTEEGIQRFLKALERYDLDAKLKEAGVAPGDTVIIGSFVSTYYE